MENLIVCFHKQNDVNMIKTLLGHYGYHAAYSCMSGANALEGCEKLGSGIVVCSYRLSDMICIDLFDSLPKGFSMLVLCAAKNWDSFLPPGELETVDMPAKATEIIARLEAITSRMEHRRFLERKRAKNRAAGRSREELSLIADAKELLMRKKRISEPEAHRLLQKLAMDAGDSITEMAAKVKVSFQSA